jgi:hypothetical protein
MVSPVVWWYRRRGDHTSTRAQDAREARRQYGVSAYTGANGGGKTFCMIWDALPSLEQGRPALSTVRLQDYLNPRPCDDDWCASNPEVLDHNRMRPTVEGRQAMIRNARALFFEGDDADLEEVEMVSTGVHLAAHPLWIPWTGWQQLLDFKFGEVLADEMTGIAESRGAMSLPAVVIDQFQQLRRDDIPFRYTMPSWERADVSLRQPTQVVTLCTGKMSTPAPPALDGDLKRVWSPKRFAHWETYEAMRLTELTEGKRSELDPVVRDRQWFPTSPVFAAYDTFAPVLRVGHASESGKCHRCGGSRRAPVCACGPAAPRSGAGRRLVVAGTPASAKREDVPPTPRRRTPRPVAPVTGRHASECVEHG